MLVTPVVNNAAFPVSETFTNKGATLFVQFSGSAWRSSAGRISVNLTMDGEPIAEASVFTNERNSHKALVSVAVLTSASPGSHTFSVEKGNPDTNIDENDYFTITVTEFSRA